MGDMLRQHLKRIGIGISTFIVGVILYLTLPLPSAFYSVANENFSKETAIVINASQKCSDETLYVIPERIYGVDNEINDERCYNLQHNLLVSVESGDIENVRNLIAKGANVNAGGFIESSNDPYRPLPFAVGKRQTEIVRLFLDYGGNVNDYYECCMTRKSLLMIAVTINDAPTVKLLLSRNAGLDFEGYENENVFTHALRENNPEIISLLEDACERSLQCRIEHRAKAIFVRFNNLFTNQKQK